MRRLMTKFVVLSIGCAFFPQIGVAGVVFTINSTDKHTGASLGTTEVLVEGTMLKMTSLDNRNQSVVASSQDIASESALDGASAMAGAMGGGHAQAGAGAGNGKDGEMVFDAETRKVTVVDDQSKEYFVVDEAMLTQLRGQFGASAQTANQMNTMMQQAYEQALAALDAQGLSPQERAAAEQMLRNTFGLSGMPTGGVEVEDEIIKGERDTINGFPVIWYAKKRGGRIAIADWDDLGPGADAQDTMEKFFEFLDTMTQGGFESDSGFLDAVGEIGGFPVAGKSFEGGDDEDWELESVTERDLDPDAFEPPPGYRLRTMGGFFQ